MATRVSQTQREVGLRRCWAQPMPQSLRVQGREREERQDGGRAWARNQVHRYPGFGRELGPQTGTGIDFSGRPGGGGGGGGQNPQPSRQVSPQQRRGWWGAQGKSSRMAKVRALERNNTAGGAWPEDAGEPEPALGFRCGGNEGVDGGLLPRKGRHRGERWIRGVRRRHGPEE